MGLPWWLSGKESASYAGDLGLIPGLGRSPGEENGYPFQYSGLENSMDYTVMEYMSWNIVMDYTVSFVKELDKTE